jgi:hypothetical protein
MNDFERHLTDLLHTGTPQPERIITASEIAELAQYEHAPKGHRSQRWGVPLMAAAAVLVAVAVPVVVIGHVNNSPAPASPSLSAPTVAPTSSSSSTASNTTGSVATCLTSQLSLSPGPSGGAAGSTRLPWRVFAQRRRQYRRPTSHPRRLRRSIGAARSRPASPVHAPSEHRHTDRLRYAETVQPDPGLSTRADRAAAHTVHHRLLLRFGPKPHTRPLNPQPAASSVWPRITRTGRAGLEGLNGSLGCRVASRDALPDVVGPVLQGGGLGLDQSDVNGGQASLEAA